jgi:antitoxin YefM
MSTLSVAQARARFSQLVDSSARTHERFEVTRNGVRTAVLLSADDYDALVETLDVLADSEEMAAISAGLTDLRAGATHSAEEVRAAMEAAGRLPA